MRNETTEDPGLQAVGCLALAMLLPVSIMINGWVGAIIWRWLIVPTFHVAALTWAQAAALALVVSHFTYVPRQSDDESTLRVAARSLIWLIVYPAFTLLVAGILRGLV